MLKRWPSLSAETYQCMEEVVMVTELLKAITALAVSKKKVCLPAQKVWISGRDLALPKKPRIAAQLLAFDERRQSIKGCRSLLLHLLDFRNRGSVNLASANDVRSDRKLWQLLYNLFKFCQLHGQKNQNMLIYMKIRMMTNFNLFLTVGEWYKFLLKHLFVT